MLNLGLVVPRCVVRVAYRGLPGLAVAHQAFLIQTVSTVKEIEMDSLGSFKGSFVDNILESGEGESFA
jgi:hypothetical protein